MTVAIIMPKFEMSQETGQLVEWYKREGEPVKKGEALFAVETDKVTMDVDSPGDGLLAGVTVQPGDRVPVTTVIAYLLQAGEALPAAAPAPTAEHAPAPVPEPQPAPAPQAQPRPAVTPVARRMASALGVDPGQLLGSGPRQTVTKADVQAALQSGPAASPAGLDLRATPAARRAARESGVALETLAGSGPRGRIQEDDVVQAAQTKSIPAAAPAAVGAEEVERIPFAGMRRTIAERLTASYQSAPHIYLNNHIDATRLLRLRKHLEKAGGEEKITLTAVLLKCVAAALANHPALNSRLNGEQIERYRSAHLGVAVALAEGLIVPVIRDAEYKGIGQIAAELNDLASRARQGRLIPAEVTGGTFTVSNLGAYGVDSFTAILNPGQAGILAVGAVKDEVVPFKGKIAVRPILRLTLAVDHRLVDGATAAAFLAELCRLLEEPDLLLY